MNVKTKTQKIIKVGNSYAITLDSEFVEKTGLKNQPSLTIRYDMTEPGFVATVKDSSELQYTANKKLSTAEKKKYLSSEITPEYQAWVEKTLEEDREAMEALANL